MARAGLKLKRDLKQIELVDGRAGADTLKLWEAHRDHAFFWRALALIQIPATSVAMIAALIMFFYADTVIEVPERPQLGHYSIKQLPDSEFIRAATESVNLIASYQSVGAREQFRSARKFLWEPALSTFEKVMMKEQIQMIEQMGVSQMFFIDTKQIKVERHPDLDKVVVRLPGVRRKLIGQKPLPPDELVYYIKMTTIPRNIHNEFGIVIVDIRLRNVPLSVVAAEDRDEQRDRERQERIDRREERKRSR